MYRSRKKLIKICTSISAILALIFRVYKVERCEVDFMVGEVWKIESNLFGKYTCLGLYSPVDKNTKEETIREFRKLCKERV